MQKLIQLNIKPCNHRCPIYIVQLHLELLPNSQGQRLTKLYKLVLVELRNLSLFLWYHRVDVLFDFETVTR